MQPLRDIHYRALALLDDDAGREELPAEHPLFDVCEQMKPLGYVNCHETDDDEWCVQVWSITSHGKFVRRVHEAFLRMIQ